VFARNQFKPHTVAGKQLLAHELTHVVQQSQTNQSLIQRWIAPTDWLDYIGLGVDAIERIYIEMAYKEGEEKDYQRFLNNLFFIIDGVLAALPGAGGGGLAFRGSRQLAIAGWGAVPDSIKIEITAKLAKEMGWTIEKALQMINRFFSVAQNSGGGGSGNSNYKAGDKTSRGRSFTDHGAERANERGFSNETIDNIIDNNFKGRVKQTDPLTGEQTWRYQDRRGNTVVTDINTERIVTVYSNPIHINGGNFIPK